MSKLTVKDFHRHPCFNPEAKGNYGRVHLPVAPRCNIKCNFCDRKYDCVNESRPGVASTVLTPAEAIDRVRPALSAYARNITHMGPAGTGQTTKLCNQVIAGTAIAVIAEAVTLAQNAGVDARRLPEAFAGGFADSKPLQIFLPRMVAGWEDSIGAVSLLLKDLDTAADLARASGTPLPMASLARELFRQLAAQGRGEEDPSALVTLYRKPK
jgi:3-hydroxyisobutyrate dehydrogenase-like beta-hydroxyacid dehydrogenase